MARGMFTEDRFAKALLSHPRARGLIVAEPYRSYAGRVRARFGPWREARFPTAPGRSLYAPSRWGRSEPLDPRRSVKAYEAGLRRRAEALGLERPAVISSHPFLVGLGDLDWAGPATYYGWDDWLASEPHRAWWPAYEAAFAGMRERRTRVCGVTPAVVERIAPTGPSIVVPNGVDPGEWEAPGPPPRWFTALRPPRFAYVGSLDGRVDVDRIAEVAAAFPDGTVAVVGPMLDDEHFERLRITLLAAIASARLSVMVVTPYFLPDAAIVTALNVAALRGVEVDILLPAKSNLPIVQWASTAQLWQVLERGCRVWLTPPPFDHTKLTVVDRAWVLFGSSNWDPRSLRLNFEFDVECYDCELAEKLQQWLRAERLREARPVKLADVDGRRLPMRLRDGLARLLSPYL